MYTKTIIKECLVPQNLSLQLHDMYNNKKPLLQINTPSPKKKEEKKWRCWEHFSIKVSYVSWYRRWQGMVISHFLPHWQEMYMHIFSENGDIIRGLGLNTVKERNWCRIPLLNQVSFTRIWTSDWLYNYTCIYMYMYTLQIHWNNRYIIILYMCTSDNMNKLI